VKPHWLATATILCFDPRLAADRTFPAGTRFDRVTFNGGNVLLSAAGETYILYPRCWCNLAPAGPRRRNPCNASRM
jgi:hypothetical protein